MSVSLFDSSIPAVASGVPTDVGLRFRFEYETALHPSASDAWINSINLTPESPRPPVKLSDDRSHYLYITQRTGDRGLRIYSYTGASTGSGYSWPLDDFTNLRIAIQHVDSGDVWGPFSPRTGQANRYVFYYDIPDDEAQYEAIAARRDEDVTFKTILFDPRFQGLTEDSTDYLPSRDRRDFLIGKRITSRSRRVVGITFNANAMEDGATPDKVLRWSRKKPDTVKSLIGSTVSTRGSGDSERITGIAPNAMPTALDRFKSFVRTAVDAVVEWDAELVAVSVVWAPATIDKARAFLRYGLQGLYLTARDTSQTLARRGHFAQHLPLGPADADSSAEFFRLAGGLDAPTGPIAWINVADGSRLDLADAVTVSGTVASTVDLLDSSWIEALTSS